MKKQGADVIGAKAGAKPKKPYIQKDTIGSTQNAEIVYGVGDGENGGLINGLNSIILDGTRVIGNSGEENFNEVKYEERFGLIDQPPLKLIEDTITERGLNLEVRSAAPVVSSFNNKDVDKFVVRISVPSLMQNKDNGDSVAASISYAIDISVDGGAYQTVVEAGATEKITNGYEFEHEIEAPEGTQRTIRVRRTTPDSTSQLLINKFYVAAISEVINAKFAHPTLHYIGLVFNAEQFNNIPKVVFHYYGRKIKVPVNYNPTTRQYDGIWNGTFKVVYSNNPAWVLFDILTDRRSGLGRRIPVELVDKWELYRIGQYCDELVPDGEGGMEPRFVCNNLVLNSKQDAYQVLKDIASIFRGQSFWNGSQVVTVADAPRDIDYAISMASVISYSYSGTARNARHNVVKVQYYDKNNENAAAYEYATDYDSIRETEQINEVEIRAFGCTSAGQAQRLARYTLLSEQTETRILTAKLSMDAFVNMQIGDVFAWSDKFLAGANNGGRVVAVNGAELTLDRDVTGSALVGDTLFVNTTSGKASTRTITAINGNKVTLDAVMSTTEPEFVWVIDSADLSLLYFKLDDYKVNPSEGTVDIVGIQHVNSKFGTIDTETALEAPPFSKVEIETLRAPGNVTTNYNVRVDQGINIADLYVAWGQVKGATRYTVEFRRDDQAWRILGTVTGLTHTIENVSAGIYEVRVRAADSIGNLSPYGFASPINVAGVVLPPPKLASFSAVGKLLAIATKWTFPAGTEASLAVVIEHATQDPKNGGVPTQKLNIPYPQSEYVFNGLGAHTQMWFRAAIVDKYNQEGAFTAWTTATADANPDELIDLISGHISEGTLDQTLKGKIDGASDLAGEAHTLANQAKTDASNAQTAATNAGTAAANAQTAATNAANAVAKEVTDRVAAVTAETNARTAALTKEATDRATALTTQANTLKADSAAKVKALKDEVDPKLVTLQDGITKVTTDYKAADTAVVGQINAYKTSSDSAVASLLQKAESAVATGATNSSAITAINGQITTINNTKLDASVISGYYTKGQTDAKAAEIAAGKVEEFSAGLSIGLDNLLPTQIDLWEDGYWNTTNGVATSGAAYSRTKADVQIPVIAGEQYSLRSNTRTALVFYSAANARTGSYDSGASTPPTTVRVVTIPANSTYARAYLFSASGAMAKPVPFDQAALVGLQGMLVKGTHTKLVWQHSALGTSNQINANSTAIQDTNAEVTRVDGVATAANTATTALAGRVSTVEGAVATKAEAAALTALTTRVTSAEGVNTSQGSAITTLQNSVNHATTGLASKASSAALTAVDNKVTAANGRIDTTNSNVTALTGRVDTVEGAVSTKAEAAALTSLTTRVSNAEGVNTTQGSAITSLENSVNHATTGLATKASSSALTAVDNKVTAANGRIDTTNSNVTTLTGRVDTVEGDIAKKADASALSALTTRVATEEGKSTSQGSAITALQNTINHATTGLATKAASSALTAVDNKVTAANGRIDTTNSNVTTLSGRVSTVEGDISKKADASALNSLTTRVETEEGKSTSQGTAITALQNTVNHATTGLATKASSSALTTVDNKVTTVDGRVNTTNSNVATLTGRVSTVEGTVKTKADVAAVNALTTRVGNVEGGLSTQATNTTNLTASLAATDKVAKDALPKIGGSGSFKTFKEVLNYYLATSGTANNIVIETPITYVNNMFRISGKGYNYATTKSVIDFDVSGYAYQTNGTILQHGAKNNGTFQMRIRLGMKDGKLCVILSPKGTNFAYPSFTVDAAVSYGTVLDTFQTGWSGSLVAEASLASSGITAIIEPSLMDVGVELEANANAISTTNAEVSRINDVVSGHVTDIRNLTTSIAGKADASALNSLTARVATEEGKSTSQGTAITNLQNAVNHSTTGLASKASSQALTTLNNQVQHSTTGLSAVNTKVDNLKATVENTTNGLASKASSSALDTLSNKVNHSTTGLDAIANKTTVLESAMEVVGTIAPTSSTVLDLTSLNADTYYPVVFALSGTTRTRIQISAPLDASKNGKPSWRTHANGFSCMYDWETNASGWGSQSVSRTILTADNSFSAQPPAIDINQLTNSSREYIFLRGGAKYTASYSNAVASTQIVTASTTFTSQVIAPKSYDASKVIGTTLSEKAAASAVESLTTRVGTAEGKINTEAAKLSTLSTTVGGHTTTINSQTTSINGIRGVHAMKFDTNGVISGYGLISELVNGTVKSQFGVNANNFFIGAPSSNKKPFVVYTTPGVINGVTVPAGTYIDTAFIGAATIGTAHIRDLNVTTAKIDNLAVTTAKIGNLQVDTLKIKDNAVTVPVGISYPTDLIYPAGKLYDNVRTDPLQSGKPLPNDFATQVALYERAFGDMASITVNRAGGKALINATITVVNMYSIMFLVIPNGSGSLPDADKRACRMTLSVYRGTTLVGRSVLSPNGFVGSAGIDFSGTIALSSIVDATAITGNTTYTVKLGVGYFGSRTDVKIAVDANAAVNIGGRNISVVELKK